VARLSERDRGSPVESHNVSLRPSVPAWEEESVDYKYRVGDKVKAVFGDDSVGVIIRLTELSEDEPGYVVQFGAHQDDFGEEELEPAT
jgi:hypothetical protein